MGELSHFNEKGFARMVDVTDKSITSRSATATGKVKLAKETFEAVKVGKLKKGDVLAVAQVAGIMGAKKTYEIIPMCHPIIITSVDIDFDLDDEKSEINILATVKCKGETGVEMEALNAVSVAALTIYDMCKAIQKDIEISEISLKTKTGGKSGTYEREM